MKFKLILLSTIVSLGLWSYSQARLNNPGSSSASGGAGSFTTVTATGLSTFQSGLISQASSSFSSDLFVSGESYLKGNVYSSSTIYFEGDLLQLPVGGGFTLSNGTESTTGDGLLVQANASSLMTGGTARLIAQAGSVRSAVNFNASSSVYLGGFIVSGSTGYVSFTSSTTGVAAGQTLFAPSLTVNAQSNSTQTYLGTNNILLFTGGAVNMSGLLVAQNSTANMTGNAGATFDTVIGNYAVGQMTNGTANTVAGSAGIYRTNGGTATEAYSVWARAPEDVGGGGTITRLVTLKADQSTLGDTNWTLGAGLGNSFIEGNLRIGASSTVPTNKLDVDGLSLFRGGFITSSSSVTSSLNVSGLLGVGTNPNGNANLFVKATSTTAVPFLVQDESGNMVAQIASGTISNVLSPNSYTLVGPIYNRSVLTVGNSITPGTIEVRSVNQNGGLMVFRGASGGSIENPVVQIGALVPSGGGLYIGGYTASTTLYSNSFLFGQTSSNNSGVVSFDSSGNVSASGTLQVFGTATFRAGSGNTAVSSSGNVYLQNQTAGDGGSVCRNAATGLVTVESDSSCLVSTREAKTDIVRLRNGLETVMRLQPSEYRYKPGFGDNGARPHLGLIAEEVFEIDPRLVSVDANGKLKSVEYANGVTAELTMAIQELNAKVESQAKEIAELKKLFKKK